MSIKNISHSTSLLALFMTLSACNNVDVVEEEMEIRKLWDKTSDYVCKGDWENYSLSWAHTAHIQLMHSDQGDWITGWEKLKEKYEALLKSGMRCTWPKNDLTINVSKSGDMAWGTVDCIIQFDDSLRHKYTCGRRPFLKKLTVNGGFRYGFYTTNFKKMIKACHTTHRTTDNSKNRH